ncbi:MAG TPA: hypothetical protein VFO55_06230 [Gemmatimonadaceae bacterium]|nr:hypothetical protein [Gemmatimonadaceae bacterium]
MAYTHQFDCIVCGEHFEDEKTLQHHNQELHTSKQAINPREPAEPMGTERARGGSARGNPSKLDHPTATPRYGSAGSGGAEYEPGPEKD